MHIRKATVDDATAAFEIRNLAILSQCTGHYNPDVLAKWTEGDVPVGFIHDFAKYGYVCVIEDSVVGVGMIDLETGMVDAMFVRPEHFGKGLGKGMLRYLEMLARQTSCKVLKLDASLNAVEFYRACGFIGEQQAIFHSPRGIELVCVPMEKILS
ncbi:GNAT family N-acetyltransferase [Shewanella olleyana]|uniref:GNAT family N-acetyltransferase n=1 Tax=Shewanella olleyana TaxID=135626 RepID=UPI00200BBA46|nr:GNAT family N-acetyltransferase [Shewanella olleyana]MCL1068648.1 GNAT family N-acetyltransferase [Shewanella olleyana]